MLTSHAYVVEGYAHDMEAVLALLRAEGIDTTANADLYVRCYGAFTIDDAREITARSALKAVGKRRVFVLAVDSINAEAQNALLKTLEEPRGGALFILLHPSPETLLPTVRSRTQRLVLEGVRDTRPLLDISTFLQATPAKRLDLLKPLLEKDDDDKRSLGEILAFLGALERQVEGEALHAVYRARKYIGDRGALVKPLLEQVALLV